MDINRLRNKIQTLEKQVEIDIDVLEYLKKRLVEIENQGSSNISGYDSSYQFAGKDKKELLQE